MNSRLVQHPKPPDWSLPQMQERQVHLIQQFQDTRPLLVAKLDELAPFIGKGVEHWECQRAVLVANAYADLWGLQGSVSMLYGYIQRLPDTSSEIDFNRFNHMVRTGLDLGDYQLFDTGIMKTTDCLEDLKAKIDPYLQEDLVEYPQAAICLAKGFVVGGVSTVDGWSSKAVVDCLRKLVAQTEASNMDLATAPASENKPFVSRL